MLAYIDKASGNIAYIVDDIIILFCRWLYFLLWVMSSFWFPSGFWRKYFVAIIFRRWITCLWEYTGFGTPIGLLNLQTNDCPNIVLCDECHNITLKPRRFPLGTLGTDPIADKITCTLHMEMLLYTPWRSLNARLI